MEFAGEKQLNEKRLPCDLERIIDWFSPLKERIDIIAIDSTCNGYWLVDELAASGFEVVLANADEIDSEPFNRGCEEEEESCELV